MNIVVVFLVAVGLAMDAFAVSIGLGIRTVSHKLRYALKVALFFGAFQAVMPVLGWALGEQFNLLISGYDHWVAFLLLILIGIKMIYEGVKKDEQSRKKRRTPLYTLFILSIATSIDALAVGVSFAFLNMNILTPALIIGAVTFILSFLGVDLGKRLGLRFKNVAEILGGVILIVIALKILIQHTMVY